MVEEGCTNKGRWSQKGEEGRDALQGWKTHPHPVPAVLERVEVVR